MLLCLLFIVYLSNESFQKQPLHTTIRLHRLGLEYHVKAAKVTIDQILIEQIS